MALVHPPSAILERKHRHRDRGGGLEPPRPRSAGNGEGWTEVEPPQQPEYRHPPEEVSDHDRRLQPQGDRPRPESHLERDEGHEGDGKRDRPARFPPPVSDGKDGEDQDCEPKGPRKVAVDHFAPRLATLDGRFEAGAVRTDHHPAVTTRPVRASEPRARKPHPRAENDHREREHRDSESEPAIPLTVHQTGRPCEHRRGGPPPGPGANRMRWAAVENAADHLTGRMAAPGRPHPRPGMAPFFSCRHCFTGAGGPRSFNPLQRPARVGASHGFPGVSALLPSVPVAASAPPCPHFEDRRNMGTNQSHRDGQVRPSRPVGPGQPVCHFESLMRRVRSSLIARGPTPAGKYEIT